MLARIARCAVALMTIVVCGGCAGRPAPAAIPSPAALRGVAIAALQSDEGEPFIADSQITAAIRAMLAVYRRFPAMRHMGGSPAELELTLSDSAERVFRALHPAVRVHSVLTRTGLRQIDSVNTVLGASGVRVGYASTLRPVFTRPINVSVLETRYHGLREVRYAIRQINLGQSSGLSIRLNDRADTLGFSQGWGDCMSGCIYRRGYTFVYERSTRRARLVFDSGDPTPDAGWREWRRRADWAAFDRLPDEKREAFAENLARDQHTPLTIVMGLALRGELLDSESMDSLLARSDVRRSPSILARLGARSGEPATAARTLLFRRHALPAARNRRTPDFVLREVINEYVSRNQAEPELSRALLQNPRVRADHEWLAQIVRVIRSESDDEPLRAEACRVFEDRSRRPHENSADPRVIVDCPEPARPAR